MILKHLTDKEYIFCLEYFNNHIIKEEPVEDYVRRYTDILFSDQVDLPRCFLLYNDYVDVPVLYFKSLFYERIDEALLWQENNIKYCENKLKENKQIEVSTI